MQGHVGVLSECTACHTVMPSTVNGGPHGMHPTGQAWVNQHGNMFESGAATTAQCQACHGADYRGTVLSRAQGQRSFVAGTETGTATVSLFRGAMVGCYTCHNGPSGEGINNSAPPQVSNLSTVASVGRAVSITLPASTSGLQYFILAQAAHGRVGLNGRLATYYPDQGFIGTDTFTYSAYDGAHNSAVATVTINVGGATDTQAPNLQIATPADGATIGAISLVVSGTASDSGCGNNGVGSVTVNGSAAAGGSANGAGTANWTATVALQPGQNNIVVVAKDTQNNTVTRHLSVTCSWSTNAWKVWWQNADGRVAHWDLAGVDRVGGGQVSPTRPGPGWKVVATGDFSGHGDEDLIFQHTDGTLATWCMDDTNCVDKARLSSSPLPAGWQVMGSGEMRDHHHRDLLIQHTNGWLGLLLMNGTNAAGSTFLNPSRVDAAWKITGTADLNNDGHTDILFQHRDGWLAVWYMNGTNRLNTSYLNPPNVDPTWKVAGTIDFNGDGQTELLWRHDTGLFSYWLMSGTNRVGHGPFNPNMVDPVWKVVGPK